MGDAVGRGATTILGGKGSLGKGHFWRPTVLTNVPEDARIMVEEPFGPVAPVLPFSDFDDALRRANSVDLGLAAYAFTGSLKTATAVADALEFGWLGINSFSPTVAETPFGGFGDSGFGYEGGPEGFDAYCRTKSVSQASFG